MKLVQERCLWFLMTLSIANTTFEGKRGVICDIVIIIYANTDISQYSPVSNYRGGLINRVGGGQKFT